MLPFRTHENTRLEAFSDAVFGFALTLLVIKSTVPQSYAELVFLIHGIPAFACCFALLVWIWYEHARFFNQYDIRDARTILLNSALLFFVVLYIYPLKFMFDSLMREFGLQSAVTRMTLEELARASMLYGIGFFLLTSVFALLYLNAHRQRADLNLDALAAFDARTSAGRHMLSAGVGLFAFLFALLAPRDLAFLSPASFGLLGPVNWIYSARADRRRMQLLQSRPLAAAGTR